MNKSRHKRLTYKLRGSVLSLSLLMISVYIYTSSIPYCTIYI